MSDEKTSDKIDCVKDCPVAANGHSCTTIVHFLLFRKKFFYYRRQSVIFETAEPPEPLIVQHSDFMMTM